MFGPRRNLRSATAAASGSTSQQGSTQRSQNHPGTSASASADAITSQISQVNLTQDEGSSDNDEGEEYGDMHRLVLQGFMAAGYLDAKGVKKLFLESCKQLKCKVSTEEHLKPSFFQNVVREINQRIQHYDMMIRSATCEVTGQKFYVFLITIEKQIMKTQSYFTKSELELFQKILDSILRKHRNFNVTMMECVNIAGELDSRVFSKTNAEDFVLKMISLKYLTKVTQGPLPPQPQLPPEADDDDEFDITLGFRTIREFEPIFREMYPDVFANCSLCKSILLNGLRCPSPKCPTVLHRYCLTTYIKACKVCFSCKARWKTEKSLLTRVNESLEEDDEPASQQVTPTSQGRKATQDTPQSSESSAAKRPRVMESASGIGMEVDMPVLEPMVSHLTNPRFGRKTATNSNTTAKAAPTKTLPARRTRAVIASDSD